MRNLDPRLNGSTKIVVVDDKGAGGANHEYLISNAETDRVFCDIRFQKGGVKEAGINGCHNEDLIQIVIDRLRCFQAGPFPCEENGDALAAFQTGLYYLEQRTQKRVDRGVEGESVA